MIRNYLTIALRNLKRRPGYTLINIAGLAVGMACCLLIGLYMEDELSFDRFHDKAGRLVVLGSKAGLMGPSTTTPYPLGTLLENSIPDVERVVRTSGGQQLPVVREETKLNTEQRVLLADAAFFEVFSFPLRAGDPRTVLDAPDGAVITEQLARAYFSSEDPIGKTLQVRRGRDTHTVTIRGVAADVPANSTLRFDLVTPLSLLGAEQGDPSDWGMYMYDTYALLREGASLKAFNEQLAAAVRAHFSAEEPAADRPASPPPPGAASGGNDVQPAPGGLSAPPPPAAGPGQRIFRSAPPLVFFGLPLPDYYLSELHPSEGFKGKVSYLYIFGSAALFVLLIAAINYVNLVTAQATQRAREVGVRKTLGAGRAQLARQFLSESALLSTAALVIALVLTAALLPAFNALFGKALTLGPRNHSAAVLLLPAFVLLVSVAAGAYPAFVLSRFRPAEVLRGAGTSVTPSRGGLLRQALVVLQFTISVVLIIGTAVIYRQLQYVQEKSLGFSGAQVAVISLPDDRAEQIREAFKQRAAAYPGIEVASLANAVPGRFDVRLRQPPRLVSPQARTEEEGLTFAPAVVDYDFIPALGLKVLAGRAFSRGFPSDEARAYILNETAARALGWTPAEAVGKPFRFGPPDAPEGEIIGVVEDFHIASLHDRIEPVVLQLKPGTNWFTSYVLVVKLAPDHIRGGLAYLKEQFEHLAPGEPFRYTFLDDSFAAMYRAEEQLGRIFTTFAALAILIACLGLFGLAAFTAERRTKEIGIRKVFGATVSDVVALLSKDFLRLVVIAFVVAAPLAYFAMQRWLQDFAYRVAIGYGVFLLAGVLAVVIALLTVGYQSVRAALADPVKSLRHE